MSAGQWLIYRLALPRLLHSHQCHRCPWSISHEQGALSPPRSDNIAIVHLFANQCIRCNLDCAYEPTLSPYALVSTLRPEIIRSVTLLSIQVLRGVTKGSPGPTLLGSPWTIQTADDIYVTVPHTCTTRLYHGIPRGLLARRGFSALI